MTEEDPTATARGCLVAIFLTALAVGITIGIVAAIIHVP